MIRDLIKIANSLDGRGFVKEADALDAVIASMNPNLLEQRRSEVLAAIGSVSSKINLSAPHTSDEQARHYRARLGYRKSNVGRAPVIIFGYHAEGISALGGEDKDSFTRRIVTDSLPTGWKIHELNSLPLSVLHDTAPPPGGALNHRATYIRIVPDLTKGE